MHFYHQPLEYKYQLKCELNVSYLLKVFSPLGPLDKLFGINNK